MYSEMALHVAISCARRARRGDPADRKNTIPSKASSILASDSLRFSLLNLWLRLLIHLVAACFNVSDLLSHARTRSSSLTAPDFFGRFGWPGSSTGTGSASGPEPGIAGSNLMAPPARDEARLIAFHRVPQSR